LQASTRVDAGAGRAEILAPHFVDLLEMLHVADIDVDAADIVHGAAGLFDRGLQILAHLCFDIPMPAIVPSARFHGEFGSR